MILLKNNLNQKKLKEVLRYDSVTGLFEWVSQANNRKVGSTSHGYIIIMINGYNYRAHRLAWLYVYGVWPKHTIDHIDHIKVNNRIKNLRDVEQKTNCRNGGLSKRNTSGVTGVRWHKRAKKWAARIMVDGAEVHLGLFSKINNAAKARKLAERKNGFHKNHGMG